MKRSVSRASKVSTDALEPLENSFPGIPDDKWHEFLEKEEIDLFILGLREEIVSKCVETCYNNYLEKQAVAFTVHCAYLAWCKVINVYYMFRDPGDSEDPKGKKSWEPDPEPEPSFIDSWGSECIVPVESKQQPEESVKESEKVVCETVTESSCSAELYSFASDLFNPEEEGYFDFAQIFSPSNKSIVSRKRSLFSSFSCTSDKSPCTGKSANLMPSCGGAGSSKSKKYSNAKK